MIDTRRQDDEVSLVQMDPDPAVGAVADVKVAVAVANVPNLLILVQVLREEGFDLVFVGVAHLLGRHGDLVAVAVAPRRRQRVHRRHVGQMEVEHADAGEAVGVYRLARVVRLALVALEGGMEVGDG